MGGIRNMLLFPRLKWDSNFLGGTGYIDRILPKNMTYPIMIGLDEFYLRPFIAIRTSRTYRNKYLRDNRFKEMHSSPKYL